MYFATVFRNGRFTIPVPLRKKLGLKPGQKDEDLDKIKEIKRFKP